jgi:5-formyltetrahydrofolate cyclo-ligase
LKKINLKLKTPIPKSEVRKLIEKRQREIRRSEIIDKSLKICDRLTQADDFVYANNLFIYISKYPFEVDTKKIIETAEGWGKSVFIPKFNPHTKAFRRAQFTSWEDLVLNEDGFLEPKIGIDDDMVDIDLVLVPCVAVSILGQRVGAGGGFYDALLRKTHAPKYALAFEFQVFTALEYEMHDIRIDRIVTERRIIDTRIT